MHIVVAKNIAKTNGKKDTRKIKKMSSCAVGCQNRSAKKKKGGRDDFFFFL